jgi:hypothetical protein
LRLADGGIRHNLLRHDCREDDMRSLMALAVALALAAPSIAHAQVNCSVYGTQVYCPNGQNLSRYRTQTYDNGGQRNSNRPQQDNRAPNRPAYGNQVYGPNGRLCTRYGTQMYCN